VKQQEVEDNIDHLAELSQLDPEMFEAFFEQATEIIDGAKAGFAELRRSPGASGVLAKMFQDMHTLKGSAMSFGLVRVAAKAHWVEDAFSTLTQQKGEVAEATLRESEERVRQLERFFDRIQAMAQRVLKGAQPSSKDLGATRASQRGDKVSVEHAKLVDLVEWVGQTSTALGTAEGVEQLVARIRSLALVPMSKLYARFPKMVEDLAETLGRDVNPVRLEGGDVELSDHVLNQLGSAVVHIVRNSMDHGIEPPDQRRAQGKPERGTVGVRCRYEGGQLRLEIYDDGKGIDETALAERAREQGLLEEATTEGAPQGRDLMFLSGLSTSKAVTNVSGRGLGMGAVRDAIEALGGTLAIDSTLGRGTTIAIEIPEERARGRG
jgi:chemotaxis protein histidine kinase CheA